MAHTPTVLADSVLTGSVVTQYTVPDGTYALIKTATVCNTTAGVLALTVQLTARSGGTARTVISARNVSAGGTDLCPELVNQFLEAGGLLAASGNGLTFYSSGVEIVL